MKIIWRIFRVKPEKLAAPEARWAFEAGDKKQAFLVNWFIDFFI